MKTFTLECTAYSKAFIEEAEVEYPSSVVYNDNAAFRQLQTKPISLS